MSETYYEIENPQITLKLTLEETNKLYIHEEIIPQLLVKLIEDIVNDNMIKDPVIVDEKTLVVLDGMHRVAAVKELGLKYIPICLVDYDNPNIGLYFWSRSIIVKGELRNKYTPDEVWGLILNSISRLGYRLTSISSMENGLELLSRRDLAALIVSRNTLVGIKPHNRNIKAIYDSLKRIENSLLQIGFEIKYNTEKDSLHLVESGEAAAAIIPPTITKSEVRAIALSGQVFIHKATRHVIPARPLRINIPLEWLRGSYPLNDVRRMLVEHLKRKKIKVLPPGTILDRRYDEELYIFE